MGVVEVIVVGAKAATTAHQHHHRRNLITAPLGGETEDAGVAAYCRPTGVKVGVSEAAK